MTGLVFSPPPPEEIPVGGGLLLRRWRREDARALHAAVVECRPHLRPWMPWARHEPEVGDLGRFLGDAVTLWDEGHDFGYAVVRRTTDGAELMRGGCGLHGRLGPDALEIGYWLHPAETGRGNMTRAVEALVHAARGVKGVRSVEIHCDLANVVSAAVARRAGFTYTGSRRDAVEAPGEVGTELIWVRVLD